MTIVVIGAVRPASKLLAGAGIHWTGGYHGGGAARACVEVTSRHPSANAKTTIKRAIGDADASQRHGVATRSPVLMSYSVATQDQVRCRAQAADLPPRVVDRVRP